MKRLNIAYGLTTVSRTYDVRRLEKIRSMQASAMNSKVNLGRYNMGVILLKDNKQHLLKVQFAPLFIHVLFALSTLMGWSYFVLIRLLIRFIFKPWVYFNIIATKLSKTENIS